jgi:hypothetical protein
MYHSLLLWRLMQCLELQEALDTEEKQLITLLRQTAGNMLGWLNAMTFSDGSWPMFNDAAVDIAPQTAELQRYASHLRIYPSDIVPRESGYRMVRYGAFELAVDIGAIQPAFQPGHAHADVGTFCLHFEGQPVIVDTGASTYQVSPRRAFERSTWAHNTVAIGGISSSEMWKSFRIARRANIIKITEENNSISVTYTPYAFSDVLHRRSFLWNDNCIRIDDSIEGYNGLSDAYLHFDPEVKITHVTNELLQTDKLNISVHKTDDVQLVSSQVSAGFNRLKNAKSARFCIKDYLIIKIGKR